MTRERALYLFAGCMVLLSVALTRWVHPGFVWFTLFIGANLIQNSFTGICPATWVFKRLGIPSEAECALRNR